MLESISSLLLQELPKKQLIIEKLLSDIPSNSNTAKHLSRNQKQKVQEESVKAMVTKKERRKEVVSWRFNGKWLHEYGLSKNQSSKVQMFSGYTTEYVRHCQKSYVV